MTLHPQAAALIERAGGAVETEFMTLSLTTYRTASDARVQAMNTPSAAVERVEDVLIPGPESNIPARIYYPRPAKTPLGVLLFFHGGGWTVGNLDTHDASFRLFAERADCIVVAPDFRLAPEHRFPAAFEDCWWSTAWVSENIAKRGGDPERIVLFGESSGGNLAAAVSQTAKLLGRPHIAGQVLVYPVLDVAAESPSYARYSEGFLLTREKMRWFIRNYLGPDQDGLDWRASPLRAPDLSGLPPTTIVTAEFDPLTDEAAAYAEALGRSGVDVSYRCIEGWPHGFFFWPDTPAFELAIEVCVAAVRQGFAPAIA